MNSQASSISILESEVADTVSTSELHYSLSEKLSTKEFVKYFEKVEKIVGQCELKESSRG